MYPICFFRHSFCSTVWFTPSLVGIGQAINAVNTIKHNWTRGKARKQRKEMIRMRQITGAKTDVLLTLTAVSDAHVSIQNIRVRFLSLLL